MVTIPTLIGLLKVLFPHLNFVSSLVISACLTPTDPILAAAITGGNFALKYVPEHLRNLLQGESAANDGMAYPFLTLAVFLTIESSTGAALQRWFLVGVLCKDISSDGVVEC